MRTKEPRIQVQVCDSRRNRQAGYVRTKVAVLFTALDYSVLVNAPRVARVLSQAQELSRLLLKAKLRPHPEHVGSSRLLVIPDLHARQEPAQTAELLALPAGAYRTGQQQEALTLILGRFFGQLRTATARVALWPFWSHASQSGGNPDRKQIVPVAASLAATSIVMDT